MFFFFFFSNLGPFFAVSFFNFLGASSDCLTRLQTRPALVISQILSCLQFKEGKLPVRYLGLLLIPGKPSTKDYQPFIDKIVSKIHSWSARKLSFSEDCSSFKLLSSIVSKRFGLSTFILPKKVIQVIEHHFNFFLWQGKRTGKGGCEGSLGESLFT